MPNGFRKPNERLKKKPIQDGFKPEDNPLETASKHFFRWVNTRLGWKVGAAVVAGFALWIGWDKVKVLPGVAPLLTHIAELRSIPHAQGDKFSILIAKLGNDKDGQHRGLIDDALRGRFDKDEIEVLLPDRTVTVGDTEKPQEAVKAGHERALALLQQANANVMIWGAVLDTKTDAPMRLHWTVNSQAEVKKSSDKYRPAETNYDLPELFWTDLSDVLGLLATSQGAAFFDKTGTYIADRLEPFLKRVRSLVVSGNLVGQKQANVQRVLADGLQTYGEQRGDNVALQEAVNTYREALTEFTRERVPLDWAMTQNNLATRL